MLDYTTIQNAGGNQNDSYNKSILNKMQVAIGMLAITNQILNKFQVAIKMLAITNQILNKFQVAIRMFAITNQILNKFQVAIRMFAITNQILNKFQVAIRMFAITKRPLTKKDFQRAVKASTGAEFDEELVDVIFDVFDEDNDNKLGHDEFMKVEHFIWLVITVFIAYTHLSNLSDNGGTLILVIMGSVEGAGLGGGEGGTIMLVIMGSVEGAGLGGGEGGTII